MESSLATRREQMLGRFADLALELAEQVHADAMAAETPAERAELARAFHTLGRTLRQTFALDARLAREAQEAARRAARGAEIEQMARVHRRERQLAARVRPLIWSEHEGAEAEDLEATLDELLVEDAAFEGFLDRPLDAQVIHLCERLGLPVPRAPTPEDGAREEAAVAWRSSG